MARPRVSLADLSLSAANLGLLCLSCEEAGKVPETLPDLPTADGPGDLSGGHGGHNLGLLDAKATARAHLAANPSHRLFWSAGGSLDGPEAV